MKLIIDRLEGGFAVCEKEDLSHVNVDGVYTIDEAETLKRRQTVSKKLRRLFGN